jgi:hypothetical protein
MSTDSNKQSDNVPADGEARTDDLLASGADAKDGARGFGKADPGALQTGMEGIAGATTEANQQSESSAQNATDQTLQDNPGQVSNKQGG